MTKKKSVITLTAGLFFLRLRHHPDSGRPAGRNVWREMDFRRRNFGDLGVYASDPVGGKVELLCPHRRQGP